MDTWTNATEHIQKYYQVSKVHAGELENTLKKIKQLNIKIQRKHNQIIVGTLKNSIKFITIQRRKMDEKFTSISIFHETEHK